MNVLVSANEEYLKALIVTLVSLHENTNHKKINIYFLNVSVTKEKIEWIKNKLLEYNKFSFNCIDIDEKEFCGVKIFAHFSVETYSRLLLLKVLPKNVDRILWLDADVVIHNNIDDFYDANIEGYSIIACESINKNIDDIRKNLNMPVEQKYFNAGILLFNMEYLHIHFGENELMNYAVKNVNRLKWLDQDVLNAVLGSSALIIDYHKYNYMHFSKTNIDIKELLNIRKNNCILHYIGPDKPWHAKFRCKTYKYWAKYAKMARIYPWTFFIKNKCLSIIQYFSE